MTSVVVIGLLLRLRQFCDFPSLWFDEAMLAVNIAERSFGALTLPLEYNQGAPLGFLWIQKAVTELVGLSDSVLRLFPLAASCVALVLFARLAQAWLNRASLLAVALMAVSPPLLDYAVEAKQYSGDVMVVVVLWIVAQPWLRGDATFRDYVVLAISGAACLLVSHPSLFVLPGIALGVAVRCMEKRTDRPSFLYASGVFLFWALVVGALYTFSLRSLSANTQLLNYWQAYFLPLSGSDALPWLEWALKRGMVDAAGLGPFYLVASLASLGALRLGHRSPFIAVVVFLPLGCALIASGLRLYPFAQRLILFCAPAVFLAVAAGIDAVAAFNARGYKNLGPLVAVALGVLVLIQPVLAAVNLTIKPLHGEDLRPKLEQLVAKRRETDAVYVYYGAKPALRFYSRALAMSTEGMTLGRAHRGDPGAYADEIGPLRSAPRLWFVFSHACPSCETDEQKYIVGVLNTYGKQVQTYESEGAALYLFESIRVH